MLRQQLLLGLREQHDVLQLVLQVLQLHKCEVGLVLSHLQLSLQRCRGTPVLEHGRWLKLLPQPLAIGEIGSITEQISPKFQVEVGLQQGWHLLQSPKGDHGSERLRLE